MEIYCYVKIKPLPGRLFLARRITELNLGYSYGEFPVFINDKGEMQLKSFQTAIIKPNGKGRAHVLYMVAGRPLYSAVVAEWSKKPIENHTEKLSDRCRYIVNQIKGLQEQKRNLVCQVRKKN